MWQILFSPCCGIQGTAYPRCILDFVNRGALMVWESHDFGLSGTCCVRWPMLRTLKNPSRPLKQTGGFCANAHRDTTPGHQLKQPGLFQNRAAGRSFLSKTYRRLAPFSVPV